MATNTKTELNGIPMHIKYISTDEHDIKVVMGLGKTVLDFAKSNESDFASNFSFATDSTSGIPVGWITSSGKVVNNDIPKTKLRKSFCVQKNGTIKIGYPDLDTYHSVQGSPTLLESGSNVVDASIKRDDTGRDIWYNNAKRIRVGIGLMSDKTAVLVHTLKEITLHEFANVFIKLGCKDALNGDGGGSSYHYPVNTGWGRKLGSALILKDRGVKEVDKPLLIIDAGHGGKDGGVSGNGIIEKELNLQISMYQYKRFQELGVKVAMTRTDDTYLDSTPRTDVVKASGAKYCISNHNNGASSTTAQGFECIHSIKNNGALAKKIAEEIKDTGHVMRPTPVYSKANSSGGDYYYMHRQTGSVSTVVVEYDFVTNVNGAKRLKDNWKPLAEAVVKAFCEFNNIKYTNTPNKGEESGITNPNTPNDKITESTIVVNGKTLSVKGENRNGTNYIPIRAVSEALGFNVIWDNKTQTVYIDK